jgi:hypothetical protein
MHNIVKKHFSIYSIARAKSGWITSCSYKLIIRKQDNVSVHCKDAIPKEGAVSFRLDDSVPAPDSDSRE